MSAERLTTLTAVKEWLGIETTDSDAALLRMIDAASRFVLNYLSRPTLRRATYTQQGLGNGKPSMMLGNWPIISVTSVEIGASSIEASLYSNGSFSSGYVLTDDRPGYRMIDLYGYSFHRGAGVRVIYEAGFETTETAAIPADAPFQLTPTSGGPWASDGGVMINDVAATQVASGPTIGQYAVTDGVYTFAAADAGKYAAITYAYVPADIAFAVTEIVGEWYKRKDRIGVLSKTLGGQETVVFNNADLTAVAAAALQPYRNVVPL